MWTSYSSLIQNNIEKDKIIAKFWQDFTRYVKEYRAVVQDTREMSVRMVDPAATLLKKAEISLQQAQMEVLHHVWVAAVGTAGEGTLHD